MSSGHSNRLSFYHECLELQERWKFGYRAPEVKDHILRYFHLDIEPLLTQSESPRKLSTIARLGQISSDINGAFLEEQYGFDIRWIYVLQKPLCMVIERSG